MGDGDNTFYLKTWRISTLRELDAGGRCCGITDSGLRSATQLVMLNAWRNSKITTVAPFGATLRELDASSTDVGILAETCGITDSGLCNATQLVKLNAEGNSKITTVAPFASTLRDLGARYACGISDSGLRYATQLVKLKASSNSKITMVAPFGSTMRELNATENCGITV